MNKDLDTRAVRAARKPYQAPELTEYGSITALTKDNTMSITPEGTGVGNEGKKKKK